VFTKCGRREGRRVIDSRRSGWVMSFDLAPQFHEASFAEEQQKSTVPATTTVTWHHDPDPQLSHKSRSVWRRVHRSAIGYQPTTDASTPTNQPNCNMTESQRTSTARYPRSDGVGWFRVQSVIHRALAPSPWVCGVFSTHTVTNQPVCDRSKEAHARLHQPQPWTCLRKLRQVSTLVHG
jgi:hypothetical protein